MSDIEKSIDYLENFDTYDNKYKQELNNLINEYTKLKKYYDAQHRSYMINKNAKDKGITESKYIKDYGVVSEFPNFDIWFEAITDTMDGFVLCDKNGFAIETYCGKDNYGKEKER